ncbi:MAG: hypothetical protein R2941_23425, partial [Desulfobacterales bacterium]
SEKSGFSEKLMFQINGELVLFCAEIWVVGLFMLTELCCTAPGFLSICHYRRSKKMIAAKRCERNLHRIRIRSFIEHYNSALPGLSA